MSVGSRHGPAPRNDEGPLAAGLLGVSLGLLVGGGLAEPPRFERAANTLWALAIIAVLDTVVILNALRARGGGRSP